MRVTPQVKRPLVSRLLTAIFLLALAARLIVVVAERGTALVGDENVFDQIASNVASGQGYLLGASDTDRDRHPTAIRGPSYVLLLAACYRLFGHHPTLPLILQALLDALSVLLVYQIAFRWFRQSKVGLVAAGLYAVYPPFILMAASLLNETFAQFALLSTVSLFFAYVNGGRSRYLVMSGVVLGLCALSKPQFAPVGLLLCASAVPRIGLARAVRSAAVTIAVVGLVMSPWIIRNALVFRAFVPGLNWSGLGLWFGAGPVEGRAIASLGDPGVPDSLRRFVNSLGEVGADRWALREARHLIVADPAHYVQLSAKKFFRLWFNVGFDGKRPSRASMMVALFNSLVIVLAFVGARLARPDSVSSWFMALLALFWTAVYVPFVTTVRYALPYYALLFIFSAAGALALAKQLGLRTALDETAADPGAGDGTQTPGSQAMP